MRVIVFGAGAVGSLIGGRLRQGGADVVLIGRAPHVAAIKSGGLRIRTATGTEVVDIDAVETLGELTPRTDDVVLITAKTQDTPAIHDAVLDWNPDVAVVCATNGVEHERMALRRFVRVYAMCVQLPAQFEKPGEVTALCEPTNAVLDVGGYPSGIDATAMQLAALIDASPHLSSEADAAVMVKKFAKVLVNLGNTADAACGFGGRFGGVVTAATEEAKRAYQLAEVTYETTGDTAERQKARAKDMRFAIPEGDSFLGGSTWQSIVKGASSVETDYFNGEIVLLGRLHGLPTPANEFLQHFAERMLRERIPAGSMTPEALEAEWQKWAAHSSGAATSAT